jgi:hypothetical protein
MTTRLALWRRLDAPGHDAVRVERVGTDWVLAGTAVFGADGIPARLDYRVTCDAAWRTERGEVRGWIGDRFVEHQVARSPDRGWTLDGAVASGLDDCLDLDLGFTPATNLLQLRRAALATGQSADVPVAWLDPSARTVALERVEQRYERRSATTYWYESPRFGYAALLETRADDVVRVYPGLWALEG